MIFNRLSKDIIEDEYFKKLFNKLMIFDANIILKQPTLNLTNSEKHKLFRFADILSNSDIDTYKNIAFKIISSIINLEKIAPSEEIYTNAILSKLGNFPAINLLKLNNELPWDRSFELSVKLSNQSIPNKNNQYYTDTQYEIINKIKGQNHFSFSGPTSLGKSYIIKNILIQSLTNTPKKSFVILVPTKALINQYLKDLKEDLNDSFGEHDIQLFSSFNSDINNSNHNKTIYVLTPERLLEMLSYKGSPKIDVLYIDEAHKIAAQNDSRSVTLYLSIEKAVIKFKDLNVIFSSPLINNPEKLLDLFNLNTNNQYYVTDQSPVSQKIIYLDLVNTRAAILDSLHNDLLNIPLTNQNLADIHSTIYTIGSEHSNLIYLPSIEKTISNALEFKNYLSQIPNHEFIYSNEVRELIQFISDTIHPNCFLINCLKYGIGYHFGALPQIIRYKIEELFKKGEIKYLFCTSTLLEGVNLPAKNIFILDNKNGLSKMTDIDFWNLAGRAGRMNQELSGQIICIKANNSVWKSKNIIEKNDLSLNPVVETKINNNTRKLKSALEKKRLKQAGSNDEKILSYLANIISIDYLKEDSSILIKKIKQSAKLDLPSILSKNQQDITVPYEILSNSYNINYEQQNSAFKSLLASSSNLILPKVTYKSCLAFLNLLHKIYLWEEYEKDLSNKKVLKYYATLMNQWMNGSSISSIIREAINYKSDNEKEIYIHGRPSGVIYSKHNSDHINLVIREVLTDLENIIQYKLLLYFSNFLDLINYINVETNENDWSRYLEYGTINSVEITLQNLGLSRQSAKYINENYPKCISITSEGEIHINLEFLKETLDNKNMYTEEILRVLF